MASHFLLNWPTFLHWFENLSYAKNRTYAFTNVYLKKKIFSIGTEVAQRKVILSLCWPQCQSMILDLLGRVNGK